MAAAAPGPLHAFLTHVAARHGARWPPWQGAQARVSAGACSAAARTTPSPAPAWCVASCAGSSSPPGRRVEERSAVQPRLEQGQRRCRTTMAEQAERSYERLVVDRMASQARVGAGATQGRASSGASKARPRGRPYAPDACTSPRQSPAPEARMPQEVGAVQGLTFIRRSSGPES